jgi:hypothetical protein
LKPDWWGSPLVQEEKYQEKPVKREEIIIIIIIDPGEVGCEDTDWIHAAQNRLL